MKRMMWMALGALWCAGAAPVVESVRNVASGLPVLAPGTQVTIRGSALATATAKAGDGPLPLTLGGATVLWQGADESTAPVALLAVGPEEIVAQLPWTALGPGRLKVRTAGEEGTFAVEVLPVAPGVFPWKEGETAAAGTTVDGRFTGLGAVDADGVVTGAVRLEVCDLEAPVTRAVHTLGGLYLVSFRLPDDAPAGECAVVLRMGDASSQPGVLLLVTARTEAAATTTIGPDGGEIAVDGMVLTVPPGAVSQAVEVNVLRSSPLVGWTQGVATRSYRVEGLPVPVQSAYSVQLPMTAPAAESGDTWLVVAGDAAGRPGSVWLPATIANGAVQASLQLPNAETPAETPKAVRAADGLSDRPAFTIWAISGWYSSFSKNNQFQILYPAIDLAQGASEELALGLEAAWARLSAIGLDTGRRRGVIQVAFDTLPTGERMRWAENRRSSLGVQYQSVAINRALITSQGEWPQMRMSAAHELMHVMQRHYDPRTAPQQAKFASAWQWFEEAAAVWFEKRMAADPATYLAEDMVTHRNFARTHALEFTTGDATERQDHGYGAAVVAEYLSMTKGEPAIGAILKLQELRAPGLIPAPLMVAADALDRTVIGIAGFWRAFARAYVDHRIFRDFPTRTQLFENPRKNVAFTSDTELVKTVAWDAPDLTLQFVMVTTTVAWASGSTLEITLNDPGGEAEALIYQRTDTSLSYLGSARGATYIWDKLDQFLPQGGALLIVVANGNGRAPFQGSTALELKLEVKKSDLLVQLQRFARAGAAVLRGDAVCYHSLDKKEVPCKSYDSHTTGSLNATTGIASLRWTGAKFAVSATVGTGTFTVDGSFDPATKTVSGLFRETWETSTGSKFTWEFTLRNIPLGTPSNFDTGSKVLFRGPAGLADVKFVMNAIQRVSGKETPYTVELRTIPAGSFVEVYLMKAGTLWNQP